MTGRDNTANDMIDAFDFTQSPRPPRPLTPSTTGSPYPPSPQTITSASNTLVVVNSGKTGGYSLAPGSIVSAYGKNLAGTTARLAQSPALGTALGGVTVLVTDGAGNSAPAPIYYVSPSQVNFVLPGECRKPGSPPVAVNNGSRKRQRQCALVYCHSANTFFRGWVRVWVRGGGLDYGIELLIRRPVYEFPGCAPNRIDPSCGSVSLCLFGTGIRNGSSVSVLIRRETATVTYHRPAKHLSRPGSGQCPDSVRPQGAGPAGCRGDSERPSVQPSLDYAAVTEVRADSTGLILDSTGIILEARVGIEGVLPVERLQVIENTIG